jgi:phosphate transport system protein
MTTVARMRATFQEELDRVQALLGEESEAVRRGIRAVVKALESEDLELADEVIAFDDDVDRLYVQVEEAIQSLIARQTPVARDLRLVLAMLKVNLHLERIGDYCVTVAKLVKLAHGLSSDETLVDGFREMGLRAEEMLVVGTDSFFARDVEAAQRLGELDELIDRANRRIVDRLLELGSDPSAREWGLRMIVVSRALERIGDHVVDIGELTTYLVTGELREFTDASHPEPTAG